MTLPNDNQDRFAEVERVLGIQFHNRELLQNALKAPGKNQLIGSLGRRHSLQTRLLALVGDRFLALYMAKLLFQRGSKRNWSYYIQRLVSNANLSASLAQMEIQELLESTSGFHERTMGTVYEALVGAIYQDQGAEVAGEFIKRTLKGHPK